MSKEYQVLWGLRVHICFQNNQGQYIPAYISHVKIAQGGHPNCGLAKIIGTHCLGTPLGLYYEDNLCSTYCITTLATWKPAEVCGGTAFLTFTKYNPNP